MSGKASYHFCMEVMDADITNANLSTCVFDVRAIQQINKFSKLLLLLLSRCDVSS